jgi:hypothetical protein
MEAKAETYKFLAENPEGKRLLIRPVLRRRKISLTKFQWELME